MPSQSTDSTEELSHLVEIKVLILLTGHSTNIVLGINNTCTTHSAMFYPSTGGSTVLQILSHA